MPILATALGALSIAPLRRADYPRLRRWLATPHVARWWNHDTSPAAIEADFGPSIDRTDPGEVYIVSHRGRPIGLLQRYRYADYPAYREELAALLAIEPEAFGIDYLIGEPDALGRGLGSAMIAAGVAAIWRDVPDAPAVVVAVSAANIASRRALLSAGFQHVAQGPLEPDNPIDGPEHDVYRIERSPLDARR